VDRNHFCNGSADLRE